MDTGSEVFGATHEVHAGGTPSWSTPDPSAAPDGHLDGGLPVSVLEETTGWARVRCSNGWETWIDAAALIALTAGSFRPTHRVGAAALDARDRPDLGQAVAARLDPGLPVVEVDRWGDWVHIRCENDWEAWVDGRQLVSPDAARPVPTSVPTPTSGSALERFLPMAGAALVVVGSFLPWFSEGGFSVSAWDLRFVGLFTHEPTDIAVDTGAVLMLVVLAALPLLTHRALPRWSLVLLGALAVLCAVLALALPGPKPDPAVGLFLTLVGGLVMIGAALSGVVSGRRGG